MASFERLSIATSPSGSRSAGSSVRDGQGSQSGVSPNSSVSCAGRPERAGFVSLQPPAAVDVVALVAAGASESLVAAALASYEVSYSLYCRASAGESLSEAVSSAPSRRRRRSRRGSRPGRSAPASAITGVSTVAAEACTRVEEVEKVVARLGDGFCYLRLLAPDQVETLAERLGPHPRLGVLMALSRRCWRPLSQLQSLRVVIKGEGLFHVSAGLEGDTRALTVLRSYPRESLPAAWGDLLSLAVCGVPGVSPMSVVGAGEVSLFQAVVAPVAAYGGLPVYRGCVRGAAPTGKVVRVSGGPESCLVGMLSGTQEWWALSADSKRQATNNVFFASHRRLPAVLGVPNETWEGYSYLSLVIPSSRAFVAQLCGRSPTLAQLSAIPISLVDLTVLRRANFTCQERSLAVWLSEDGAPESSSFEMLLGFSARTDVPSLGTVGAHLVSLDRAAGEWGAVRTYSCWVQEKDLVGVGKVEARMPLFPGDARLS